MCLHHNAIGKLISDTVSEPARTPRQSLVQIHIETVLYPGELNSKASRTFIYRVPFFYYLLFVEPCMRIVYSQVYIGK